MKRALIGVAIIISLTLLVNGCSKKTNQDDNKSTLEPNTNQGVVASKEVDVFTFKNTSLIWNGNSSDLETVITNTSDEDAYLKGFTVHVYDEEGNEIATMPGYVSDHIKAHSTRTMSTGHYKNLSNAFKVEYEIIK